MGVDWEDLMYVNLGIVKVMFGFIKYKIKLIFCFKYIFFEFFLINLMKEKKKVLVRNWFIVI